MTDRNPNMMSRDEFQRLHTRIQAGKIVDKIIEDLNDRNGLEISSLDSDTQDEVREAMFKIVLSGMEG